MCINSVESYSFSFPSFNPDSCNYGSNLICWGSVNSGNGSLNITPDQPKETTQVGRFLFRHPMIVWPASFSTAFTIRITSNSTVSGDGMAFIIAQDDKPSPNGSSGSFIGIMDPSTEGEFILILLLEKETNALFLICFPMICKCRWCSSTTCCGARHVQESSRHR